MPWRCPLIAALLSLACWPAPPGHAQPNKKPWTPSPHVAATDPLPPAGQRKKMQVPPGFEVQLVAAEPDVVNPLNLQFDHRGRLWVTMSTEYPYPAKGARTRDTLKILEDFGPDGRARKVTTFAKDLNIPIGVLPLDQGTIVHSIPNVWFFEDADGDGRADSKKTLLESIGFRDTHGMTGEFVWGFDGWVYACHGYANESVVRGRDGSSVAMQSGNTYRFRPDGTRIEYFTHGQVNPFGLALDPLGNLFSTDCHTRPIYQLLRGAYYPSFGKPHDGLGFGPEMMKHSHGSTAIAGIAYYAAEHFPPDFHDNVFVGNVVTNRVNRDRLQRHGSTYLAKEQPDFLTSQDPWFRPVDIKLGPDGVLYIADFYDRIIGHYEVPLDHPGRDREFGRVWRVVYTGKDGKTPPPQRRARLDHGDGRATPQRPGTPEPDRAADGHPPAGEARQPGRRSRGDTPAANRGESLRPSARAVGAAPPGRAQTGRAGRRGTAQGPAIARPRAAHPDRPRRLAAGTASTGSSVARRQRRLRAAGRGRSAGGAPHRGEPAAAARSALPRPGGGHAPAARRAHGDSRHLEAGGHADEGRSHGMESAGHAGAGRRLPESADRRGRRVSAGAPGPTAEGQPAVRLRAPHHPARRRRHGGAAAGLRAEVSCRGHGHAVPPGAGHAPGQSGARRGVFYKKRRGAEWADRLCEQLLQASGADEVVAGIEVADKLKLRSAEKRLCAILGEGLRPVEQRGKAAGALTAIRPREHAALLGQLLADGTQPAPLRQSVAEALATANLPEMRGELVKCFALAPADLQVHIAKALSGSREGADALLDAVQAGKASPRLLQNAEIEQRVRRANPERLDERLAVLTRGLPPADEQILQLIQRRADSFARAATDVKRGAELFQKNCAACHQLNNQGAKYAPQLDGIGVRGLGRLLEDVLDPNRNVDQAFRATLVEMKDGRILTGLQTQLEGNVLVIVDGQGKLLRLPLTEIEEYHVGQISPMPAAFGDQLPEQDLHHLLAFLLEQQPAAKNNPAGE